MLIETLSRGSMLTIRAHCDVKVPKRSSLWGQTLCWLIHSMGKNRPVENVIYLGARRATAPRKVARTIRNRESEYLCKCMFVEWENMALRTRTANTRTHKQRCVRLCSVDDSVKSWIDDFKSKWCSSLLENDTFYVSVFSLQKKKKQTSILCLIKSLWAVILILNSILF